MTMESASFRPEALHQLMLDVRAMLADLLEDAQAAEDYQAGRIDEPPRGIDLERFSSLNSEMVRWTQYINYRLTQCETQLRLGNPSEAVRLADIAPKALDLFIEFESLSSEDREIWDQFSNQNGLTRPATLRGEVAEELIRVDPSRDAETNELLDRLRILVLARAPLSAKLPVLWKLAMADASYQNDVPQWERRRLDEIEREGSGAAKATNFAAAAAKLRSLMKELLLKEWTTSSNVRSQIARTLGGRLQTIESKLNAVRVEEERQRRSTELRRLGDEICGAYSQRRLEAVRSALARLEPFGGQKAFTTGETAQTIAAAAAWVEEEDVNAREAAHRFELEQARFREEADRLRAEERAEDLRSMQDDNRTGWETNCDRFRGLLNDPLTPLTQLTTYYEILQSDAGLVDLSIPPDLERLYAQRSAAIKSPRTSTAPGPSQPGPQTSPVMPAPGPSRGKMPIGLIVGASLAATALLGFGVWQYTSMLAEQAAAAQWKSEIDEARSKLDGVRPKLVAYSLSPGQPVSDPKLLIEAFTAWDQAVQNARREANTPARQADLAELTAEYTKIAADLETKLIKYITDVNESLAVARTNLEKSDNVSEARDVSDRSLTKVDRLQGFAVMFPGVGNSLSQLGTRAEELVAQIKSAELRLSRLPELTRLSKMSSDSQSQSASVTAYAEALGRYVETLPADRLTPDFKRAAAEEGMWKLAHSPNAFAIGWLRREPDGKKWKVESIWRPPAGGSFALDVVVPSGAGWQFERVGVVTGFFTNKHLGEIPPQTEIEGRLVFAVQKPSEPASSANNSSNTPKVGGSEKASDSPKIGGSAP